MIQLVAIVHVFGLKRFSIGHCFTSFWAVLHGFGLTWFSVGHYSTFLWAVLHSLGLHVDARRCDSIEQSLCFWA